jgi:hypothetical protein
MINSIPSLTNLLLLCFLYNIGGDFASRLGFQSNMPSDNSSALYWDKECDRKVQDVKGLSNNCGNSLTPPRMKLSSLISPIITSGSYHTEVHNQSILNSYITLIIIFMLTFRIQI